jgi:putative transposase
VLTTLGARVRAALGRALTWARKNVREALRPAPLIGGLGRDLVRSRRELVAENTALRQQLIVASRKVKRPRFQPWERGLLVALTGLLPRWRNAILLVKPDTILRWHREGFRLFWKHRSKARRPGPPRITADTVELIRRMATDNRTWGAERIRGELLKLGIRVAKRTIQRRIRAARPPGDGQRWRTFLKNHTVWACDYLQVYDVWFRPLFAFFVINVNSKEVVHVAVTREPTERWTAQQLRNITHFGTGPQFIIRDRDSKFGADFDRAARGAGVRVLKTAILAPLMNSTCERFLGSVRHECLDHVVIFGERHLRSVVAEYVAFFNRSRPHQGLAQRVPVPSDKTSATASGRVIALPVLGGLHHEYRWAA